jgi:hypothetical protein
MLIVIQMVKIKPGYTYLYNRALVLCTVNINFLLQLILRNNQALSV